MNVWCHLPTIFKQALSLQKAGLVALCVAFITTLFFVVPSQAATGTNQTISFSGRLSNATGGIVPDGYYNIQFKIYQDGDGTTAGNSGGTLKWTENYVNNNASAGVQVKGGYFSVTLGSKNAFGSSIDWNQDTLWLSMNVAGTANTCTTFGSGSCTADGEMLPMKQLTATPYAMSAANANQLGGKTSDQYLQLAQGVQTDASTNTSSIFINKTSTGNLIQLQNTATDVFTVTNSGNVMMGSNSDHSIGVASSSGSTPGHSLTISAGTGGGSSGASGGNLVLQGGTAGGSNENGGNVTLDAGAKTGAGTGGTISIGTTNASAITIGRSGITTTISGPLSVSDSINTTSQYTISGVTALTNSALTFSGASDSTITSANSQSLGLDGKNGTVIKTNGTARATFDTSNTLYLGNGAASGAPANFTIQATNSSATSVAGATLTIQGGNATTGNANGGGLALDAGVKFGSGTGGAITIGASNASAITLGNNSTNITTAILGATTIKAASSGNLTAMFQLQRADGTAMLVADSTNQTITFGNSASGNYTVVSTSTGQITKYGTGRNTKKITLNAEYTGSVLDPGTGSNNTGTMTSSVDLTNRMNYYKWTTSQGSNQSYDVVVQVPIPTDFDGWASSNPLSISTYTSNTTNGTITLEARDSSGTVQCNFVSVTPGSTSTWSTNTSACTLSSGTYTAGDTMTLRIRMQSPASGDVRVGNINLSYLSKY